PVRSAVRTIDSGSSVGVLSFTIATVNPTSPRNPSTAMRPITAKNPTIKRRIGPTSLRLDPIFYRNRGAAAPPGITVLLDRRGHVLDIAGMHNAAAIGRAQCQHAGAGDVSVHMMMYRRMRGHHV